MDRIGKTATTALVNYFNVIRRTATVSLSERYKLLLLWFFNEMKNDGESLYEYSLVDEYSEGWHIDTTLDNKLEAIYSKTIKCLTENTCNIKYMNGDTNQIASELWYWNTAPDEYFELLVTNDTEMIEDGYDMDNLSFQDAMEQNIWDQGSFIFRTNASNDNDNTYYEREHETIT